MTKALSTIKKVTYVVGILAAIICFISFYVVQKFFQGLYYNHQTLFNSSAMYSAYVLILAFILSFILFVILLSVKNENDNKKTIKEPKSKKKQTLNDKIVEEQVENDEDEDEESDIPETTDDAIKNEDPYEEQPATNLADLTDKDYDGRIKLNGIDFDLLKRGSVVVISTVKRAKLSK